MPTRIKASLALLLIQIENGDRISAGWKLADIIFVAGVLLLMVPPMFEVARVNWATEQGGHGPIVLGTGLWLLLKEYRLAHLDRKPGNKLLGFGTLSLFLVAYLVFGITGILELQVFAMYAALIAVAYLMVGRLVVRACWFPLFYLAFALPPPDTVVAVITQPVKIAISQVAVNLLYVLGYPVANSGVVIQIAQFELLVASACSGLNSLISLSAICLFYVYLRHRNDSRAFVTIGLAVVPVAVLANFVRVVILIILTYYAGESVAQGFLHDFAGMLTFAAALALMLAIESIYSRLTYTIERTP